MQLIVDGTPREIPGDSLETVADVVGSVSRDLTTDRRVVGVKVDGEDITGNADRHLQTPQSGNVIEVTTALAAQLALDSLESIGEFQQALVAELGRSAEEFRMGSFEKSSEIFARCVDGLRVLMGTTMQVVNLLQVEPDRVEVGDNSLKSVMERVNSVLEELIEAQSNRDGILIADLIEYELHPLLEDWQKALEELRQQGAAA